jgi:hypothetical protein
LILLPGTVWDSCGGGLIGEMEAGTMVIFESRQLVGEAGELEGSKLRPEKSFSNRIACIETNRIRMWQSASIHALRALVLALRIGTVCALDRFLSHLFGRLALGSAFSKEITRLSLCEERKL